MKITDLPNFLELNPKKIKDKKFSKINFLESLLKSINNKKEIKDIILHSNITKEQKEKLLQKFISKSDKKTFIPISTKDILLKNKKEPNPALKKETPLKKNKNITTVENLLKKDLKEKTKKKEKTELNEEELIFLSNIENKNNIDLKTDKINEKKIIKKIKTIIIQKSINNPIIKELVKTDKFKEISSFKDLIKLSEKLNLNLVKFAISQKKEIHKKINLQTNIKTDLPNFSNPIKEIKKQDFNSKISLNDLIKENKETKELKDNFNIRDLLNKDHNQKNRDKISKKSTLENNSNDIINNFIPNTEVKNHIISAKQTLKHFATNLKEAVENYKPPVTKVSLELHPKDLGKVEVTIKQRGDNLNVQINTNNTTTVNFFSSSQQELKNSLVNMGFSNINMSFNSNQDNQQQKNQPKQQYSKNNKNEDEELIIDFSYQYA